MHKSRLGALLIDCQTDDIHRETEFWRRVLGRDVERRDDEGRYVKLRAGEGEPRLLLQRVEHESRVHIDIETDDIEAEVARLQALGASIVEVMERWTVMQAPTGHRFCVINPIRDDFDENANVWE